MPSCAKVLPSSGLKNNSPPPPSDEWESMFHTISKGIFQFKSLLLQSENDNKDTLPLNKISDCFSAVSVKDVNKVNGKVTFAVEVIKFIRDAELLRSFLVYIGNLVYFFVIMGNIMINGSESELPAELIDKIEIMKLYSAFTGNYDIFAGGKTRKSHNVSFVTEKFAKEGLIEKDEFSFCIRDILSVLKPVEEEVEEEEKKKKKGDDNITKVLKSTSIEEYTTKFQQLEKFINKRITYIKSFWNLILIEVVRGGIISFAEFGLNAPPEGNEQEQAALKVLKEKIEAGSSLMTTCGSNMKLKFFSITSFVNMKGELDLPNKFYEEPDIWGNTYTEYLKTKSIVIIVPEEDDDNEIQKFHKQKKVHKTTAVSRKRTLEQLSGISPEETDDKSDAGQFNENDALENNDLLNTSNVTINLYSSTSSTSSSAEDNKNNSDLTPYEIFYKTCVGLIKKSSIVAEEALEAAKRFIDLSVKSGVAELEIKHLMIQMFCGFCKLLLCMFLFFILI